MNITTKFDLGDIVYMVSMDSKKATKTCPACSGRGHITLDDGSSVRCPRRCHSGTIQYLEEARWHVDGPYTITQVRVEITESPGVPDAWGDNSEPMSGREESYMCLETGTGSGVVYDLQKGIFATDTEAQAECEKRNAALPEKAGQT